MEDLFRVFIIFIIFMIIIAVSRGLKQSGSKFDNVKEELRDLAAETSNGLSGAVGKLNRKLNNWTDPKIDIDTAKKRLERTRTEYRIKHDGDTTIITAFEKDWPNGLNRDPGCFLSVEYKNGKYVSWSFVDDFDGVGSVHLSAKSVHENVDTHFELAEKYENGYEGMPQDDKKAIYWYSKAAEQGNVNAQVKLAEYYLDDTDLQPNYEQARYWYTKAAELGNSDAQQYLGIMYYTGDGIPTDYQQGLYWVTKAAEQGSGFAQYILGAMYKANEGIPQDYEKAYIWSSLAASQGREDAIKLKEELYQKLSPNQLAEAQKVSAEMQSKNNAVNGGKEKAKTRAHDSVKQFEESVKEFRNGSLSSTLMAGEIISFVSALWPDKSEKEQSDLVQAWMEELGVDFY